MKKIILILNLIVLIMLVAAAPIFPQTDIFRVAPGAEAQLSALLNKPALVAPAVATSLGRGWYNLAAEAHVFTDRVSVSQVAAVLLDLENQARYLDGRRSKLTASVVSRNANETIVDFVSISVVPVLNIQLRTPYRASVRTVTNTGSRLSIDVRQLTQDSDTNREIKNLSAQRYVQEVTISGRSYTYIRIYSVMDVEAGILLFGAKNTLENNSGPINIEVLEMIIAAAATK